MSYSQANEEEAILAHLPETGVLLDVGAFDGKTFSNSRALIEKGWKGVLVEPSCDAFSALMRLYKDRNDLCLLQAAVSTEIGIVPFWSSPDAVSTTSAKHRARWDGHAAFYPGSWTTAVTFAHLFATFPILKEMQFLNIDAEGISAQLFFAFPFSALIRPKVVCVEYDNMKSEILVTAYSFGYECVLSTNENLVLVHG
jgi:FkbM family methyltransferase